MLKTLPRPQSSFQRQVRRDKPQRRLRLPLHRPAAVPEQRTSPMLEPQNSSSSLLVYRCVQNVITVGAVSVANMCVYTFIRHKLEHF